MNTYKQGHDRYSTATHERRTPESDADFLLKYIRPDDHILDVGCGPGTITTGFTRYATNGHVIGIDLSSAVLDKARSLATQALVAESGPASASFQLANVLDRLPFEDDTFDIVFASQVFGHIPLPDLPVKALTEMRRVLKAGGILATRDAVELKAYPQRLNMDRRFFEKQWLVLQNRHPGDESVAASMPYLCRQAGFQTDESDKFRISVGSTVFQSRADRQWMAERMRGMLSGESSMRQNWLKAGIEEEGIREAVEAVSEWAACDDAWYMAVQCEILAWK